MTDVQFLCFYNASIWKPSLKLPAGLLGALHKGATSRDARRHRALAEDAARKALKPVSRKAMKNAARKASSRR